MKFSVFWDVTFCRVVKIFYLFGEFSRFIFLVLKKGSSSFFHNVDRFIPEYTASQAEDNIFFFKISSHFFKTNQLHQFSLKVC